MFSKLFSFILLIAIVYCALVFALPTQMDNYGDKAMNAQIRIIKLKLDNLGSSGTTAKSLFESTKNITKPYIKDSQESVNFISGAIDSKIKAAQKAAKSVGNAYKAVEEATEDISNVTSFSTGSSN